MRLIVSGLLSVAFLSVVVVSSAAGEGPWYAKGYNGYGERDITAEGDFKVITGGKLWSTGQRADGTLVARGISTRGQLIVPAGNNFIKVVNGHSHGLAIEQVGTEGTHGRIVAWGWNANGQCNVPSGDDFVEVAAGLYHSVALRADGSLVGWGQWNTLPSDPPGTTYTDISVGEHHSVAVGQDGTVVAWGYDSESNAQNQLNVPPNLTNVVAVEAGEWHTVALKDDGTLVAWGMNSYGQCTIPAEIQGHVLQIAGGGHHTLALLDDAYLNQHGINVKAFGRNDEGQCDDFDLGKYVAIGVGSYNSFAKKIANRCPIADAGPDQTAECTGQLTEVHLDGTGSSDPDGDDLQFEWSLPEGSGATLDDASSPTPIGQFPAGPTLVTLIVTDGKGGVDCDDVLITIVDTIPPVLVCTTDEIALWPPNHQIENVLVSVEVTDCAWDTDATITASVSSNEPDDGTGDGSFTGDVNGLDAFTVPVPVTLVYTETVEPGVYLYQALVSLRAERDGSEHSRSYSIACDVEDLAGNTTTASCVVVVPHDRRKK